MSISGIIHPRLWEMRTFDEVSFLDSRRASLSPLEELPTLSDGKSTRGIPVTPVGLFDQNQASASQWYSAAVEVLTEFLQSGGTVIDFGEAARAIKFGLTAATELEPLFKAIGIVGKAAEIASAVGQVNAARAAGRDWHEEAFVQVLDIIAGTALEAVGRVASGLSVVGGPVAFGTTVVASTLANFAYGSIFNESIEQFYRENYRTFSNSHEEVRLFYSPAFGDLSSAQSSQIIIFPSNANYYLTQTVLSGKVGVVGGQGQDVIDGRGMSFVVRAEGSGGNDLIWGGMLADRLSGGTGNDEIYGGDGDDRIFGGAGNDILGGGDQNDVIFGGDGYDTAVFRGPRSNYDIYFEGSTGAVVVKAVDSAGLDRLYSVEVLRFEDQYGSTTSYLTVTPPPPTTPPTTPPVAPVPGDDFGASAATAGRIAVGGYVVGAIETRGDQDWFAINLQAGQNYNFSMTGGSVRGFNTLSSPHLYLRDASGDLLADASPSSINSIFSFTPASSGTYYVNAGAHGNLGTGGYVVAVSPGGAPTSPGGDGGGGGGTSSRPLRLDLDSVEPRGEEDGASLIFKVEYSGDLTQDIDIQWEIRGVGPHATDAQDFVRTSGTVTLHEGRDYVYIRVTPTSDNVDEFDETFELVIRGPSGVSISDDTATGVIINDDAGRIQPGADELNTSFDRATVIIKDEWYRGFVNTPGDVDYFAVTLTAGETYDLIVIGDDDTSLIGGSESGFTRLSDPQATLYDANFNPVVTSFNAPINSTRVSYQFTPSQTGVFYIAVREDGGNDIGQYFVKADIRVPADDFAASTATTGRLVEGELVRGNNERDNDHDWFAVDLDAGATYSFYTIDQDSARGDGSYIWPGFADNLIINLRDASGNVVASAGRNPAFSSGGDLPTQISFAAPTAGRYFMSVEGNDGSWEYLAGYERLNPAPAGPSSVLQPGAEGIDVTFAEVRNHQNDIGVNGSVIGVGGFAGSGSSGSALRFAIDTLPDEAGYAAIELYFTGAEMGTSTNVAAIAMVLGIPANAWDESSSLGGLGPLQFQSILPPPGAVGWYRIEITDLYNAWQAGDQANNGIVLMPVNMHTPRNMFHSSDSQEAALRPRLIVQERTAEEIRGTASFDHLSGTDMSDRLFGLEGDDLINGGRGADFIDGGTGADLIDGGEGFDTVSYASSSAAVSIDLGRGLAAGGSAEGDSLTNIEAVEGSMFADRLIGSIFSEALSGGAGDDYLCGEGGDDILSGGSGSDIIDGGAGNDVVIVSGAFSDYRLLMSGDDFILKGPDGGDYLTNVETIRFGDGRVLELNRMYGPDADARTWADGRIPEALLSGGAWAGERPLVLPGPGEGDFLTAKDNAEPEVLPEADDSDSWVWKDADTPLVLPGADDIFVVGTKGFDGPEVLPGTYDDRAKHDGSSPEVLPAGDDSFILTRKTDLPPVLPPMDEVESRTEMEQARELMMALARENWLNRFDDNLTLFDNGFGLPAPSRGDGWQ